jgi:hypothetical protein
MHGSQMMYAIMLMISQTCDPRLLPLFTPPRPEMGQYEVCTRPEPLEMVIAERGAEGAHFGEIESLEPLDAFGGAGAYNRFAVTRLYGGTRVRVARGWRISAGRFESVTLLSPYPDAAFRHLIWGTMTITLRLSRAGADPRVGPASRLSHGLRGGRIGPPLRPQ